MHANEREDWIRLTTARLRERTCAACESIGSRRDGPRGAVCERCGQPWLSLRDKDLRDKAREENEVHK